MLRLYRVWPFREGYTMQEVQVFVVGARYQYYFRESYRLDLVNSKSRWRLFFGDKLYYKSTRLHVNY